MQYHGFVLPRDCTNVVVVVGQVSPHCLGRLPSSVPSLNLETGEGLQVMPLEIGGIWCCLLADTLQVLLRSVCREEVVEADTCHSDTGTVARRQLQCRQQTPPPANIQ